MTTSGFVGEEYDVDITLDREVFDNHTVTLTAEGPFHFVSGMTLVKTTTLGFDETNWDTPQAVTVVGSSEGTFPIEAICTSAYWQQLGELKEEDSTIYVTFIDPDADGWYGAIAGVTRALGAGETVSDVSVAGSLYLQYTNSGTKTMYIRKTNSIPAWGDIIAMKITKPDTSVVYTYTTSSGQHLNHVMNQTGQYRFDVYEWVNSSGTKTDSIPSGTWDAKLVSSSNPPIYSATKRVNGVIYERYKTYIYPVGPANVFTQSFGDITDSNLCASASRVGHTDSKFAFVGSGTAVGLAASATGYYSAVNGYCSLRSTSGVDPITIGGKGFVIGSAGWQVYIQRY